jgi:acyl carrier protein
MSAADKIIAGLGEAAGHVDTARRLTRILVEHLGLAEGDIAPGVRLIGDEASQVPNLGADSLDVIELVMAAEDEFNIEVEDRETEKLNRATFGELVDFVHARRVAVGSDGPGNEGLPDTQQATVGVDGPAIKDGDLA